MACLRIVTKTARTRDEFLNQADLGAKRLRIDHACGALRIVFDVGILVLGVFLQLRNQVRLIGKDLNEQVFFVLRGVFLQSFQPLADMFQGTDQRPRRRGQHLPHHEGQHAALILRKRIGRLILKIARHVLIQRVFAVRRGERLRERQAIGVLDEGKHVLAERAPAEILQPLTKAIEITSRIHVA